MIDEHGISPDEACEIVGLPRSQFKRDNRNSGSLPLPEQITAITQAIQSGEIVVGAYSAKRWGQIADNYAMTETAESSDAYTLEDLACEEEGREVPPPPWLYSADRFIDNMVQPVDTPEATIDENENRTPDAVANVHRCG